ncbi:MAG: hypothetical protein JXA11_14080 [Phycisphaerae bacterium]|nr:hypothetical protein [Phycisphaerae bacterium]
MLVRKRRTTRLDVGLALAFTGLAFIVWAFVAGMSRTMMKNLISDSAVSAMNLPTLSKVVKVFFVDTGFVIDLVGLGWMVLALVLIFLAGRQRISISWAWTAAILQSLIAALGAVLVGVACYEPYHKLMTTSPAGALETISLISLPVVIGMAVVFWVMFLIAMLIDRARLERRGPTLSDGRRTNR